MGTLGFELKSAREKRNISLAQIAAATRISLEYLKYLEEGRYDRLPGGMYNRAFLRAYCEVLDLDPQEILRRYDAEYSPAIQRPATLNKRPSQRIGDRKPNPVIAWSIMLLLSATGLFLGRKWIASVFSPYFSHVSISRSPSESHLPVSKPAPSSVQAGISHSGTLLPADHSGVPTITQMEPETVPLGVEFTPPLRLDVEVTEECWISVDSDGQPAVRRLLEPGEVRTFGAAEQFAIIIGNAGGIRLKINGKPAKPLGKSGDVVKVLINDKNLQEFIDQTTG